MVNVKKPGTPVAASPPPAAPAPQPAPPPPPVAEAPKPTPPPPAPAPAPAQQAPPLPPPPPAPAPAQQATQAVIPATQAASKGLIAAPADLPAHLADAVYTGEGVTPGFENVGASGLQLPMLIVAQPMTPTAVAQKVRPGDIILQNDKEKTIIEVGGSFDFSIVYYYREWLEWADRASQMGILNRSKNPQGDLAKRHAKAFANRGGPKEERVIGDKKVKIDIFEYHVFFIVAEGDREIHAVPLSRTAYKKGSQLIGLARKRMGCPIWMGRYEAKTVLESNAKGSWFNWDFKTNGWVDNKDRAYVEEAYNQAKAMYENVVLNLADAEDAALPDGAEAVGAAGADF